MKTPTQRPQDHPVRRMKKQTKKWSWAEASKVLGVSAKWLRFNHHRFDAEMNTKLEAHLGD